MRSVDELAHHRGRLGRMLLGYSGGVDSTLPAMVGRRVLRRGERGPRGYRRGSLTVLAT